MIWEDHLFDLGFATPVFVESLQHDPRSAIILHQFVRAGADRLLLEHILPDPLDIGLWHEIAGQEAKVDCGGG